MYIPVVYICVPKHSFHDLRTLYTHMVFMLHLDFIGVSLDDDLRVVVLEQASFKFMKVTHTTLRY